MSTFSHPAKPLMFSMVVTPMDAEGNLSEERLRSHLRRMVDAGVGVYLGSGGSGEGHALSLDELAAVYMIGVDECAGRVPVYCNPPEARSAREMLLKVRLAIDAGADLVQLYQLDAGHGRQPVVAEQEMYFREVLDRTDAPVGLAIHSAVGYLAPPSLVVRLCDAYPQIEVVNTPHGPTSSYLVQLKDALPERIKIYVGMDNILTGLALGAWGAQVTETNQVPNLCQLVIDRFVAGDIERAAETYQHVLRVAEVIGLGRSVSGDGPKAALKALGFDVGPPRPPRIAVGDEVIAEMRRSFAQLGTVELELEAAQERGRQLRSG